MLMQSLFEPLHNIKQQTQTETFEVDHFVKYTLLNQIFMFCLKPYTTYNASYEDHSREYNNDNNDKN